MSDVTVLRADVFRPDAEGEFLVVRAKGGYGKDVHFRDAFGAQWAGLKEIYPCTDSDWTSGRYLPLRNGRSGTLGAGRFRRRNRSIPRHRKVSRLFRSIFAGGNPGLCRGHRLGRYSELSNGKVGLSGVSYFATKQWQVAALQPRHLAAIIPWEGCCDFYREWSRHGGIRAQFPVEWWHGRFSPTSMAMARWLSEIQKAAKIQTARRSVRRCLKAIVRHFPTKS